MSNLNFYLPPFTILNLSCTLYIGLFIYVVWLNLLIFAFCFCGNCVVVVDNGEIWDFMARLEHTWLSILSLWETSLLYFQLCCDLDLLTQKVHIGRKIRNNNKSSCHRCEGCWRSRQMQMLMLMHIRGWMRKWGLLLFLLRLVLESR